MQRKIQQPRFCTAASAGVRFTVKGTKALLLLTTLALFVPFSPKMVGASLDPSWAMGINQAVAQGLSFGEELIFTLGPYGGVFSWHYHPATAQLILVSAVFLALCYWVSILVLMRGTHWIWSVPLWFVLSAFSYSRDALLLSYPLVVGLVCYRMTAVDEESPAASIHRSVLLVVLFSAFGLLILVKGTALFLCAALTGLCCAYFIGNGLARYASICAVSVILSVAFFWSLAGQALQALPEYIESVLRIAGGYTEAMGKGGEPREVAAYLLGTSLLLLVVIVNRRLAPRAKVFVFSILFVFFFMLFKAGFVRQGPGHIYIAASGVLVGSVVLPYVVHSRRIMAAAIIASVAVWAYIDSHHQNTTMEGVARNVANLYGNAWRGLRKRLADHEWPRSQYDASLRALRNQASLPVVDGTSDVYSYRQSLIIASGNSWLPRPVFQSYAAFTPWLTAINREHLSSDNGADNIFFQVEPIDNRMPSSEDGPSWPVLLHQYEPIRYASDFLMLRRKEGTPDLGERLRWRAEKHRLGQEVQVDPSERMLFVRVLVSPTLWGRLRTILFRGGILEITLELVNGTKRRYRMVPGLGKGGFLLSPLIEDTTDFGLLYGDRDYLDGKAVRAFRIDSKNGEESFWEKEYLVLFAELVPPPPTPGFGGNDFRSVSVDQARGGGGIAVGCRGSIDKVNGLPSSARVPYISELAKVSGWVASSLKPPTLAENVFVVMVDEAGEEIYYPARQSLRFDVRNRFMSGLLARSGFQAIADVSELEGKYTLGVAVRAEGRIARCPAISVPIVVAKTGR